MAEAPLELTLPSEIAEELISQGHAAPVAVEERRSAADIAQILALPMVTAAATTVSLLQTPQTIAYLAERIKAYFDRAAAKRKAAEQDTRENERPAAFKLEARGPKGEILRMPVPPGTTFEEIESLLMKTVFRGE